MPLVDKKIPFKFGFCFKINENVQNLPTFNVMFILSNLCAVLFYEKKILFILTDLYESYFIWIFGFIDFLNLLWQYCFYGILLFGIGCYLWQPVTCT